MTCSLVTLSVANQEPEEFHDAIADPSSPTSDQVKGDDTEDNTEDNKEDDGDNYDDGSESSGDEEQPPCCCPNCC